MKIILMSILLLSFYINTSAQTIKVISLTAEDDVSLLLREQNITKVTIDSSHIVLKLKNGLSPRIDSLTQVLLFFSFDCYCSIEVALLHDTSCCRFQRPYIRHDDDYFFTENGEIKIWYGHLTISEEEREKILAVFNGFIEE